MRTLVALTLLTLLSACGSTAGGPTILAASSLTDVLPELASAHEQRAGEAGTLVFGGSSHLAAQVRDGVPADVFLTADPDLLPAGVEAVPFATNRLVLAVPAGNPAGVTSPDALAVPDLRVAVCAEPVPCGAATRRLGLPLAPDTEEASVRAVVSRLALGEADVGVVYATDVLSSDGLEAIADLPASVGYVAAALTPAGERFVGFLASDVAAGILDAHGFDR